MGIFDVVAPVLNAGTGGILGDVFEEGKKGDTQTQKSWVELAKQNKFGKQIDTNVIQDYRGLRQGLAQGRGTNADIQGGLSGQRDLAALLQQYTQSGGGPMAQDITQAQGFANSIFAPQQLGLQQAFEQQRIQANRQAGISGRMSNDPILANKLAQDQTRQSAMLNAQQGSFAAQYAQQMPGQRIGLQQDLASVKGNLASQALQNRQSLLQLGSQMQAADRNWRVQTGVQRGESHSGGGLLGGIGAVLGTVGGVASIAGQFMGAPGGGGGGLNSVQARPNMSGMQQANTYGNAQAMQPSFAGTPRW